MANEEASFEQLLAEAPLAEDQNQTALVGLLARSRESDQFFLTLTNGRCVTLNNQAVRSCTLLGRSFGQILVKLDLDPEHVPEDIQSLATELKPLSDGKIPSRDPKALTDTKHPWQDGKHPWQEKIPVLDVKHPWQEKVPVLDGKHPWQEKVPVLDGKHPWQEKVPVLDIKHPPLDPKHPFLDKDPAREAAGPGSGGYGDDPYSAAEGNQALVPFSLAIPHQISGPQMTTMQAALSAGSHRGRYTPITWFGPSFFDPPLPKTHTDPQ